MSDERVKSWSGQEDKSKLTLSSWSHLHKMRSLLARRRLSASASGGWIASDPRSPDWPEEAGTIGGAAGPGLASPGCRTARVLRAVMAQPARADQTAQRRQAHQTPRLHRHPRSIMFAVDWVDMFLHSRGETHSRAPRLPNANRCTRSPSPSLPAKRPSGSGGTRRTMAYIRRVQAVLFISRFEPLMATLPTLP